MKVVHKVMLIPNWVEVSLGNALAFMDGETYEGETKDDKSVTARFASGLEVRWTSGDSYECGTEVTPMTEFEPPTVEARKIYKTIV